MDEMKGNQKEEPRGLQSFLSEQLAWWGCWQLGWGQPGGAGSQGKVGNPVAITGLRVKQQPENTSEFMEGA